MNYRILPSIAFVLSTLLLTAQKKSNTAFAIVSSDNSKVGWMNIQEVDLSTGHVLRTIFDKGKTSFVLLDGTTKNTIKSDEKPAYTGQLNGAVPTVGLSVQPVKVGTQANQNKNMSLVLNNTTVAKQGQNTPSPAIGTQFSRYDIPTASMVAAVAYDGRHNRLYFTPMRFGELRWLDLYEKGSSLKVYCLTDQPLSVGGTNDEANNITRMVIASDGNGYALSNDANSFTRFSTGKKPVVTKLGAVRDDPQNKNESIHDRKNWGGDMIADANGNLYVIGANHAVFKIDTRTSMASYLGLIEGLPENYTTNAAAIDNSGNLIVSSANSIEGYYKVDLINLTSEKLNTANRLSSCSDLATGYLAFERPIEANAVISDRLIDLSPQKNKVSIYPNPVTDGNFKVAFANSEYGQYSIQLIDLSGRVLSQKRVTVGMKGQTEEVKINTKLANGAYIVKIVNGSNKVVTSGKLLLQ